ncbi:hypothetical protein LTR78_007618 [Recurvomyces mirabilis]|uniref:JmjC domain-containing protein n=1 Tax=Recurvomyces mirabilis TaxID=574656 RepID=A0AAE0TRM9_9PEZI|nr:hypothetical protein LTR78_007618 [Recurvomyces mirabilis]
MLLAKIRIAGIGRCRTYGTERGLRPVPVLPDANIETFRNEAFLPALPVLLPRSTFGNLPAVQKWFERDDEKGAPVTLNRSYLSGFGSTIVPLEISSNHQFNRIEQSFSFFLECVQSSQSRHQSRPNRYFSAYVPGARAIKKTATSNDFFSAAAITPPTAKIYLAQAPIYDLPQALRDDLPTPELVLKAGKGDVYDSSIWLGQAPTYTPLHRDPNPNLFVQLAGTKVVRLFKPDAGRAVFAKVQEKIGGSASATLRGEEMMQGAEKQALEQEVWGSSEVSLTSAYETIVERGGGLFIPKGWWHSIKGVGTGMTGSVNWWFR